MLIAKSKIACLLLLSLTGCATQTQMFNVPSSKVAADDPTTGPISDVSVENAVQVPGSYTSLTPLNIQRQKVQSNLDLASSFSGQGNLTFSADALPGDEFIHTVFGEQLQVNYVISDGIANLTEPFSLNIQESVSPRQLFVLVSELLASRNISITRKDDVFFIHPKSSENPATGAFGFGRNLSDVPQALGLVTQLVPVKYNRDLSMEITIRDIAGVKVQEVQGQSAYYFQGEREKVIRAIELLNLLDTPSSRGRHIGLLRLTYISAEDFGKQAAELLASEGLPLDLNKPGNRNLVLVPLPQIGAIAVFSAEQLYVERLNYWAKQLDQPNQGDEKRYFVFHPRFARASDLGESLASLIGQDLSTPNTRRDTQSAQPAGTQPSQSQAASQQGSSSTVVENDKVRMTVDQRSNSLIFYTAGKHYKELMPLVEKLDVMPKQIMLETTIAEVTLTGEFAMGVEFAVKNGNFSMGTEDAFGLKEAAGLTGSYARNLDKLVAQLRANDKRVNVLSSPSIVVRDGVTAEINVGEDIPTVSGTTENPNTGQQTRSVGSRKTGIKLTVTPSISAQGLVVMEIQQESSNTVPDGTTVEGNQTVFERGISTEVIAQSGQTILLGGLISERKSTSENKVPGLGDLPLIGALFRSTSETTDKTELVLLITPRVIDNSEEWESVRSKLSGALELMQFVGEKTDN
jgi:general secretion pathway protein D